MWNGIAAQAGSNCTCAWACLPKPSCSMLQVCSREIIAKLG